MWTLREMDSHRHRRNNPLESTSPLSCAHIISLVLLKVALSCKGGGIQRSTATLPAWRKQGGEMLLIVSPFHRLRAVRALCVCGSLWRTQALVHEKIRCIKQLGLKGKAAQGYKHLFYVLLSLSLCMSYSLCHSCLFLTPSPLSSSTVLVSKDFYRVKPCQINSLIWQFF